ncbi:MAG: phosphohydrolase [Candidatus Amesbacteria bacterium]|nr:phosphohydrolase [Candidatus Amesbacteria bacterium]
MTLTRDDAIKLLNDHIQNENLRRHCLSVGIVMKALAEKLGGDPETWEILGIIHDSDWEETKETPEKHTIVTLSRIDDPRFTHALQSHNTHHTHLAHLEGPMEWSLECCDELTGFIVACTLVLPSRKIVDLSVESVLKKFPKKEFAKAVNRSQIAQCEEKLGIKPPDFVSIALSAMQSIASEIGL